METRVETLAELKKIRFGQYGTIFCKETEREYYFEPNGGSLTPDDLDVVLPAQGGDARLVAHKAFSSGGGGGGGGGGGAYPENVTIISGGGTHTLTLSEQGVVIVTDSTTVRLPASPPAGTTYKISGTAGLVNIDTNGALVAGYSTGIFRAGRVPFIVKALYLPGLIWGVENKNTWPAWFADAAYAVGDRVSVSGVVYESRADNNLGNDPATSPAWWRRVTPAFEKSNTILDTHFVFL